LQVGISGILHIRNLKLFFSIHNNQE